LESQLCRTIYLAFPSLSLLTISSSPFPSHSFFFYCYGDPQDLHSFPTRRSSDLSSPGARPTRRRSSRAARARPGRRRGRPRRARDRKSTRLNSSHVSISYAVFCLKKKKTKG